MTGYSGDGSYWQLLTKFYGVNKDSGIKQSLKIYDRLIRSDEVNMQHSFSFIRSGYIQSENGGRANRGNYGTVWEKRVSSKLSSCYMAMDSTGLYIRNGIDKDFGFSLRCVAKSNKTSQLSSGDASDSICPKGWGIAGTSGDGSYQKLIASVYGANKVNTFIAQKYKEHDLVVNPDEEILQLVFSFIRLGIYGYSNGSRADRNLVGYYWENKAFNSGIEAYRLVFYSKILHLQAIHYKGNGFSVRCVAKSDKTSQLSSGDASDSICPKGWGIVEYDGDRSWHKLIANAYGTNKTAIELVQAYNEYNEKIIYDEIIAQKAISLAWTGYYRDFVINIGHFAYMWEKLAISTKSSRHLYLNYVIYPQTSSVKGRGYSVRCEAKRFLLFLPVMLLTLSAPKGGE